MKKADAGTAVTELCRKHGMSNPTFYKWRSKYGGMEVPDARRAALRASLRKRSAVAAKARSSDADDATSQKKKRHWLCHWRRLELQVIVDERVVSDVI